MFLLLVLAVVLSPSTSQQPPASQISSSDLFPTIEQIGYLGPTSYGEEPSLIYATAQPSLENHFPILEPNLTTQYQPISRNATRTSFQISRHWGNLSPMYSLPPDAFGVQAGPQIPSRCSLDQVHLLHRHGARYPTSGTPLPKFAQAIAAAQNRSTFQAEGDLAFLNKWRYKLGSEVLTPFGRSQLFQLGVSYRQRYGFLLNKQKQSPPVFRTTSQDRMYHSASNFAAGFFGIPNNDKFHQSILIEQSGYNNSLAPYFSCPRYLKRNQTDFPSQSWKEISLKDTRKRLNQWVKGFQFSIDDMFVFCSLLLSFLPVTELIPFPYLGIALVIPEHIFSNTMQTLCAYESVALGTSDFCNLFTQEEWKDFSYANDLDFWYLASFGDPFAAALGAGWASELLARVARISPSQGVTSINMTLDSNPETFPLNQTIYVDATHDTVIASVIVALNLTSLAQSGPLPTSRRLEPRSFNVAQIAPFGAQLTAQVLSCPSTPDSSSTSQSIRFILNDAVVPLDGLEGCGSSNSSSRRSDFSEMGLCDLDDFIAGLQTRLGEIDFQKTCF